MPETKATTEVRKQLNMDAIAEAVRHYSKAPNADVQFLAQTAGGTLDLAAIVKIQEVSTSSAGTTNICYGPRSDLI